MPHHNDPKARLRALRLTDAQGNTETFKSASALLRSLSGIPHGRRFALWHVRSETDAYPTLQDRSEIYMATDGNGLPADLEELRLRAQGKTPHDFKRRRDPVPGIGHHRPWHREVRYPRTLAEKRRHFPCTEEGEPAVRPKRLAMIWTGGRWECRGLRRYTPKCWKDQRRTQWKATFKEPWA